MDIFVYKISFKKDQNNRHWTLLWFQLKFGNNKESIFSLNQ